MNTSISTRSVEEVIQHRRNRVAETLRNIAQRIENGDVQNAVIETYRNKVEVENNGEVFMEPTIGNPDDLVYEISLQLGRIPLQPIIDDTDPED